MQLMCIYVYTQAYAIKSMIFSFSKKKKKKKIYDI